MLRSGQEQFRDFKSKWHFMSSHFLVLCLLEPRAVQKSFHTVIKKTRAQKSSQPPSALLQVIGGDLLLTLNTCSLEPGRMQREKILN